MLRKSLLITLLAVSMMIPLEGISENLHTTAPENKAPVLALSAKLRAALMAEMVGVKEGVGELSGFIATGDWDAAALRAERIRDSYIMKQKLTPAELGELERVLPAEFVQLDEAFHRHAEGLVQAAKASNYELTVFYFSKMMEGCGNCHARYAPHVFKGFNRTDRDGMVH